MPWLVRDAKPICWISGKAGSGKSTLMKYMWTNKRTRTCLSTWAGGRPLLLAAFFFYERGESLQKSREGLIRSLLHQILLQKRELIPIVFKHEFESKDSKGRGILSWSSLKSAFEALLTHTSDSFKLCIFADGLDEYRIMDRMQDYTDDDFDLFYDGENDEESVWGRSHWIANGHKEIAELFKVAANTTNVKICLSSRELTPFQRAFEGFPRLRLHDLTSMDITTFTKSHLLDDIKSTPTVDETDGMNMLAEETVLKAQGVFLWVRLVVEILVAGFNNGDTIPELRTKLESLPPRLGGKRGLYVEMVKNINPEYRIQASRYIRILLHAWNDLDLVDLEFAKEGPFEKNCINDLETAPNTLIAVKAPINLITDKQLDPRRKRMRLRLMSRCGGLLEAPQKHVLFMHQTVKEFFLREELWVHLLPQEPQSSFDPNLALLSACILRLKCLKELVSEAPMKGSFSLDYIYIADSMHYAASSEGHGANKKAFFRLLDELDLTCTQLARTAVLRHRTGSDTEERLPQIPPDVGHWSEREPMESGAKRNGEGFSFLSYAVQAGLVSYVESKLSSGDIPARAKFGKPLLAYASSISNHGIPLLVFSRAKNYIDLGCNLPDVRVLKLLLSFGVDTNEQYDGTTVWRAAVETGYYMFSKSKLHSSRGIHAMGISAKNRMRWIVTIKSMLRHGANLEEPCFTDKQLHGHKYKDMDIDISNGISARELIRYILRGNIEYSKDIEELEEIFEERDSRV